jgi:predicted HTH domain antitoxin
MPKVSVAEYARLAGVSKQTIYYRLRKEIITLSKNNRKNWKSETLIDTEQYPPQRLVPGRKKK